MTDEQASAARYVDRGYDWVLADWQTQPKRREREYWHYAGEALRQAMHDRDRYQRERDYWREQCIDMQREAFRIGKYRLRPGSRPELMWIELADGPAEGEGGEFSTEELEQALDAFYLEHF